MRGAESVTSMVINRLRPLVQTAALVGAVGLLFAQTEEPIETVFDKTVVDRVVEPALHKIGINGWWEDDNPQHLAPAANVGAGKIEVDEYLGAFTTFVSARAELNAKVIGKTLETSKSMREGYVVNRLKLPSISVADVRTTPEAMYITVFKDGVDVGIDLSGAKFETLNPDLAENVNGVLECAKGPEDPGFSGCITKDTIRSGFFANLPVFGEDDKNNIYNSAELLFDEYGQIEKCHFDSIIIPAFNEAYKKYSGNGIHFVIDGPNRYQMALEVLVRGFWRDSVKQSRPPQAVIFNLGGQYKAKDGINARLQHLDDTLDFPFSPPSIFDPAYCSKGPEGTVPLGLTNTPLDSVSKQLENIAILGLPQVPDGYNPITKAFESNKRYSAPSQKVFESLRSN